MMRTLESLFVVIIVFATLTTVFNYGVLPAPIETSSIGLKELADSTITTLDKEGYLTQSIFTKTEIYNLSPSKVGGGSWTTPDGAFVDGVTSAQTTSIGDQQVFYGYGLNVGPEETISQVKIRLDAKGSVAGKTIKIEVSNNGGVSWLPTTSTLTLSATESLYWVDVTSWDSWTPVKVNGDSIRVRVTSMSGGGAVYLDWIPLEINTDRSAGSATDGLPPGSVFTTYSITNPEVTVTQTPEKITRTRPITLYILDIAEAKGWWITGYDGHALALEVQEAMNPYFNNIVMITNMIQYEQLLNGTITTNPIDLYNAIVVNPFGETIPIPHALASDPVEWDTNQFTFRLGQRVNRYNWTWVSLVGYPFYYLTNTERYSGNQNGWGIYGMNQLGPKGYDGFLYGIDNPSVNFGSITLPDSFRSSSPGLVEYADEILKNQLYYGIFPGKKQTATRAFPISYLSDHNLVLGLNCFSGSSIISGAIYDHIPTIGEAEYDNSLTNQKPRGSLMQIGLARTPDVRVMQILLLARYQPKIHRTQFDAAGTTRLITLQIGQVGTN